MGQLLDDIGDVRPSSNCEVHEAAHESMIGEFLNVNKVVGSACIMV